MAQDQTAAVRSPGSSITHSQAPSNQVPATADRDTYHTVTPEESINAKGAGLTLLSQTHTTAGLSQKLPILGVSSIHPPQSLIGVT